MNHTKKTKQPQNRMLSVHKLIQEKYMIVDSKNYHVSMLAELWNMYYDEGKIHLCQNILNYCNVENACYRNPLNNKALLVSIKDSENKVAPFAYYKNGKIEIIENHNLCRQAQDRIADHTGNIVKKVISICVLTLILVGVFLLVI